MNEHIKPSDSLSNYLMSEKNKLDEQLKNSKVPEDLSEIEKMLCVQELLSAFTDQKVLQYVVEEPGDNFEHNDFERANEYFPWYEAIGTLLFQIGEYMKILNEEGQMEQWNEDFLREILHKPDVARGKADPEAALKRMQSKEKKDYQKLQNQGITSLILQDLREYITYNRKTKSAEAFNLYQATLVTILNSVDLSL